MSKTVTTETTETTSPEAGHGARIVAVLEAAWFEIQQRHPDVPDVVMITGSGHEKKGMRLGHFGADHWRHTDEGRNSELFIAGQTLAKGPRAVLQTLLHEAAHGVAHVRKIKDTSGDGNRYHNKRFAALARELGLTPPAKPVQTHGYSWSELTDETVTAYAAVIESIEAARLPYLPYYSLPEPTGPTGTDEGDDDQGEGDDEGEKAKPKERRAGKRFAVVCACEEPRRIQVTPKIWESGGLSCDTCRQAFVPEGEPRPERFAIKCGCGRRFDGVTPDMWAAGGLVCTACGTGFMPIDWPEQAG